MVGTLYGAVLVGAMIAMGGGTRLVVAMVLALIPAVVLSVVGNEAGTAQLVANLIGSGFLLVVIAAMLTHTFRQSRITLHSVLCAMSVFLPMGVLWQLLYEVADAVIPGAFIGLSQNPGTRGAELFYFSYVTLTTLGYGDVTPARPETMSLAAVEAIIGQAYLVVLIAYLVSRLVSEGPAASRADTEA